jgi:hypothetical protein
VIHQNTKLILAFRVPTALALLLARQRSPSTAPSRAQRLPSSSTITRLKHGPSLETLDARHGQFDDFGLESTNSFPSADIWAAAGICSADYVELLKEDMQALFRDESIPYRRRGYEQEAMLGTIERLYFEKITDMAEETISQNQVLQERQRRYSVLSPVRAQSSGGLRARSISSVN